MCVCTVDEWAESQRETEQPEECESDDLKETEDERVPDETEIVSEEEEEKEGVSDSREEVERERERGGFMAVAREKVQEDIDKGKAVREQISELNMHCTDTHMTCPWAGTHARLHPHTCTCFYMFTCVHSLTHSHTLGLWDGVLEGRIKLHKLLSLSNSLPQTSAMPVFLTVGGERASSAVKEGILMY